MSESDPLARINHNSNLTSILGDACDDYQLGALEGFSVITTGYEDCNIITKTESGQFLAKIFSKDRSLVDITRYTKIISHVVAAGVSHPEPLLTSGSKMLHRGLGVSLIMQEFIEGSTFYDLQRGPSPDELDLITEQAAKINKIDYRPPFYEDSWAVPSINKMFEKVKNVLGEDDRRLLEKVTQIYQQIPTDDLPHSFVHGDIISTNVIKGRDKQIYVIDFSVANWYPRVQELAVMASSLLEGFSLKQRCDLISESYEKFTPLEPIEKDYLYDYATVAAGMELIGACDEKYLQGNNSRENEHWLSSGRATLSQVLEF